MKLHIVLGMLCSTTLAFAQAKTEKTEKPAGAPAMEMPKPSPDVDALLKNKTGSWKCEVKAPETPMGPAHTFKSKLAIKKTDLAGFWYQGRYEELKSKEHPMEFKADDYWGYDTAGKRWVRIWVDSTGGWAMLSGTLDGTKLTWTGDGMMMGKKTPIRHTMDFTSDKEMHDKFEIQMNGKWMSMGEGVCKK